MTDDFNIPTPAQLKELRKDAGLTQTDVANMLGKHCSTVGRMEKGETSPSLQDATEYLTVIRRYKAGEMEP